MKYAIIAAGEGSRLAQEGVAAPKPLVKVGGEMLIDRLIRIFMDNNATEICVICNEQMTEVAEHLDKIKKEGRVPLKYIVKSTLSSMHSLWELSKLIGDEPFVLTTVDTIFDEQDFKEYAVFAKLVLRGEENGGSDGLFGVTEYIDDEKPLYVGVGTPEWPHQITGFYDTCDNPRYISAGIYGMTPKAFETLNKCIERGESRMRNFQRALIADGVDLMAWPFLKVMDIDHASDIEKAEAFLEGEKVRGYESLDDTAGGEVLAELGREGLGNTGSSRHPIDSCWASDRLRERGTGVCPRAVRPDNDNGTTARDARQTKAPERHQLVGGHRELLEMSLGEDYDKAWYTDGSERG